MNNDKNEVFQRFRDGDQSAFTHIYNLLLVRLYLFVFRLVGRKDEAEDIVAETLEKLWNHRRDMVSMKHALDFAFITARNASISCLRKIKRKTSYDGRRVKDLSVMEAMADPQPGTLTEILLAEHMFNLVLAAVKEEIANLPPRQQEVFRMLLEERSIREIRETLGIRTSTVHNHKDAAFKKIREALEKKGLDASMLGLVLILGNL